MILDLLQALNELTWPGALGLASLCSLAYALIRGFFGEWSRP